MKNFKLLMFPIVLFFSCTNIVDCNEIKYDNGISYYKGFKYSGDCKSVFFDGAIKSKQSYVDGLDNGSWIFYYSNGNKKTEAFFKKGKRINSWKYYSKSGFIYKINDFDSLGKPAGIWKTYDTLSGNLLKKTDSKDIKFD